ncbi:MAG: cytochrome d ubiquinol oxidase subunit II [Chloroflexota bacterium]|nr:cytochrome d ubiquinol oxidase subunit II [Chloroflexota bacterium]
MILNEIWFILFVVIIGGYLILDGFDMGVGILHMVVARTDAERRTLLNSIGPVWDGNEVWLVLGGGVLFAVFPFAYASLFSGFYIAFMLVLVVIILRAVTLEFRSQRPGARWRSGWDLVFGLSSLGLALLLGVAFGAVIAGVPLGPDQEIHTNLFEMLTPFALLVGLATVAMFAMHGAIYLIMKTEGELQARCKHYLIYLMGGFVVLNTLVVIAAVVMGMPFTDRYLEQIWPVIFPAAALVAMGAVWYFVQRARYFLAFSASSLMILLLLAAGAIGMHPNLLISNIDAAYNLTIFNAASEENTLMVALVIALIGMPFVLLYTTGVYYIFRGKVSVEPDSY